MIFLKQPLILFHVVGQGRFSVVLDGLLKPQALTVHGDFVYCVDSDTEMMYRANKKTSGPVVEIHGKFSNLADVEAIDKTRSSGMFFVSTFPVC